MTWSNKYKLRKENNDMISYFLRKRKLSAVVILTMINRKILSSNFSSTQ